MTPVLYVACKHAIHVVEADGTVHRAGRACLFTLDELGWHRVACFLALPPFIWLVELSYWIVAANRPFFSWFSIRKK
jgi:predicted DCC family thiol-disulfide oxidoreductase YuxK